jgi:hypothetical protein
MAATTPSLPEVMASDAREAFAPDPYLPLNVDQSVEVRYPFAPEVAGGIEMVFVDLDSGAENVSADSFPLKVDQSAVLIQPRIVRSR